MIGVNTIEIRPGIRVPGADVPVASNSHQYVDRTVAGITPSIHSKDKPSGRPDRVSVRSDWGVEMIPGTVYLILNRGFLD